MPTILRGHFCFCLKPSFSKKVENLVSEKGAAASVASGKRVSAAGWWFSYEAEQTPPTQYKNALVAKARSKPVIATNLATGEETIFPSAKFAAETLSMSRAAISFNIAGKLQSAKGYKFRFK